MKRGVEMKNELESSIQRRCQKIIKDNDAFVFKTHGDMYGRAGIPDLVACVPVDVTTLEKMMQEDWFSNKTIGIFVGIELKRPGHMSEVSPAQIIVGKEIKKAGGLWYATDDVDTIEALMLTMRGKI